MLLETKKRDYALIIGVWIFTITFELVLCSISHDVTEDDSLSIAINVGQAVVIIMIAYCAIILTEITNDFIWLDMNEKKFEKTPINFFTYVVRAFALFTFSFLDLLSFYVLIPEFFADISHSGNKLPVWQTFFLQGGFSAIGLVIIWRFRKQKMVLIDRFKAKSLSPI